MFVHDSEDSSQIGTKFSHLPGKIMENIFCRLPIVDLMLNCSLVCPAWREIISKDTVSLICFLTWLSGRAEQKHKLIWPEVMVHRVHRVHNDLESSFTILSDLTWSLSDFGLFQTSWTACPAAMLAWLITYNWSTTWFSDVKFNSSEFASSSKTKCLMHLSLETPTPVCSMKV